MDFHHQFQRAQLMAEQRTMLNLLRKLGMLSIAYGICAGVHVLYSSQPEWIQIVSWVVAGVLVVVGVISYARPTTTGLLVQIAVTMLVGGLKLVLAFFPGERYGALIGAAGILGALRYIACYPRLRLVESAVPASSADLAALTQLGRELIAGKVDDLPDVIAFQSRDRISGNTAWRARLSDDLVVLADRDGLNLLFVPGYQFEILIDSRPGPRERLNASVQWQGVNLKATISRTSFQKYLNWKAELEPSAPEQSVSP